MLDSKCAVPIDHRPCASCCPICTKDWHKTLLLVDRNHVVRFLRHMDRKLTPLKAKDNNVVDLPWTEEKWRIKDIFHTTNITKYHVDSLFLRLIASGMIMLSQIDGILQWSVVERIINANGRDFTLLCEEAESRIGINVC